MKRAVIADDHTENLYFLEVLLQASGFTTVSAENGARALELVRAAPTDLVISDILMPVMDGYSLCKAMKTDPLLQGIPFVFYTATFTTARDEELALSLGADRFLVKPMEPDRLMAIIAEVLAAPRPQAVLQTPDGERQVLKEYSEALFRKLEKKMTDLEQANRALQQQHQELLKAYEEAECANQAKLRFLHIMSHELRTPLSAIMGTLQLIEIEKTYDAQMTTAAKTALLSLVEMIDNLLEASRIEAAEHSFYQGVLKLEQVLLTLNRLFGMAAQNKGLQLRMTLSDALPREVLIDGARLQQIMVHLVNNAIKFTEQGEVVVSLSREEGRRPDHPLLKIEVHDSGPGIDPELQREVFRLFTQGNDTDTRTHGGTGIGLFLTKRLVELMGGTIALQSTPGVGSVFTVRLPLVVNGKKEEGSLAG